MLNLFITTGEFNNTDDSNFVLGRRLRHSMALTCHVFRAGLLKLSIAGKFCALRHHRRVTTDALRGLALFVEFGLYACMIPARYLTQFIKVLER